MLLEMSERREVVNVGGDALELLRRTANIAHVDAPEVVLPRDRDLVARGMRFHYLDWGHENKRPILFLHGGGLTAHTFDLVCLALRADYWCLALDQRGHGDSEWSPVMDYDTTTQAEDAAAFIESLGLQRPVVVGMSMGGMNAIEYAGTHRDVPAALVIIDVGPELQAQGTARIRSFMSEQLEFESLDELIERAVQFNPRRDPLILQRSLRTNLRQTPKGSWVWKWDPRPRSKPRDEQAMVERRLRLWNQVALIDCPTLVIRGAESDVFSRENAETFVGRLRNGRLRIVEGAGHTVQGDNPAGLTREIRAFLTEIGI
jgi:pimeloyl-ACP methyl ester carboxylesterase